MRFWNKCCGMDQDCRPTSRSGKIVHCAGHAVFAVLAVGAVALLFGWVTMTAWNAVIPSVFNLPLITFWQAVGLMILGRILVGRFHCHSGGRRDRGRVSRHSLSASDATPPDGGDFAQWWWEEGEAAFRLYQVRQADKPQA